MQPTAARRTQKQRSATMRARLLDATIDTVVRHGYAGTSTTEICKLAGVSRGAQLHHFPTKAELVAAAVERLFERRHRTFRRKLAELADPHDIAGALGALWSIYRGPTLHAWMELAIAARTDAQLRRHVAKVDDRFFAEAVQTLRAWLQANDWPADRVAAATRLLLSTLDGLAVHRMVRGDDKSTEAGIDAVLRLLEDTIIGWLRPRGD